MMASIPTVGESSVQSRSYALDLDEDGSDVENVPIAITHSLFQGVANEVDEHEAALAVEQTL